MTALLFATVLAPVAVCVYAFPSSVISAVPLLVDLPYGGVAVTGAPRRGHARRGHARRAAAARASARGPPSSAPRSGAAGFAAATAFATTGWLPWLVLTAPLLGSGGGLCLAAGLTLTARLAAPTRRGALTALFLAIAYLGLRRPVPHGGARGGHVGRDAAGRGRASSPPSSRCGCCRSPGVGLL